MSTYPKVAVIHPNFSIVLDPEKTLEHYIEEIYSKVKNGETILFKSDGVAVIYKPNEMVPLTIMSEKKFLDIRREQQYAAAMSGKGGIVT